MQSLKDKIVFITGASSGIGLECAKLFAKEGVKLIIAARRVGRLKALSKELKKKFGTKCNILKLDVRDNSNVEKAIKSLTPGWKNIDVLVNNAGLSRGLDKLHEGKIQDWEEMIDTNIKGLLYVSKAVIPIMVKRNSGHVINIGSIAGHEVYPKGNVYCATKFAVDAITKGMRLDLNGTNIRVTTIDPGLVETEFSIVRHRGNKEKSKKIYEGVEALRPDDIADAVFYAATRRDGFTVAEMILFPTDQASVNIINRK
ncbi:MAG: SDR family NAD(P)-dependent oxidoreductase [Ignavibacteria bacterium]